MRHGAWAGAAALLLLVGAAACGDDDDGGGPGAIGGSDAEGSGGANDGGGGGGGDVCSLLEVAEIEAEFGDHGTVADGEPLGISCSWEIGDMSEPGSGVVGITSARGAGSPEQSMAEIRDLSLDPIEVEGIGDEAFLDSGILWFRSGDRTFSVSAFFSADIPNVEDKLTPLARHILDRA